MEYWKVNRWLKVRDKTTDWGPVIVVFFSIILSITFFGLAKINHETDSLTLMEDSDGDKQFDNPWAMNDGRFSFTIGGIAKNDRGEDVDASRDPNVPYENCRIDLKKLTGLLEILQILTSTCVFLQVAYLLQKPR